MVGEGGFIDELSQGNVAPIGVLRQGVGAIEVVAAANVLNSADNGKTFILSLAGGFATTLPKPFAGARYRFIVGVAPTTAYTIGTTGATNIINGQICSAEDAAGSVSTAAAADVANFVANLAIIGDWMEFVSDGTRWYVSGMCKVQDGITTVQTA